MYANQKNSKKGLGNVLLEALKALILLNCTIWPNLRALGFNVDSNVDSSFLIKPANAIK